MKRGLFWTLALLVGVWSLLPASAQTVISNNAADMANHIVMVADSATPRTVTNLFTFDRGAAVPFAVGASSLKVTNLDADKLDGQTGSYYQDSTNQTAGTLPDARLSSTVANVGSTETITAVWTYSAKPNINAGLQFPATQAASADANTLDDYEEGSWTPTIGGSTSESGQAYTTQVGRYRKIGKEISLDGNIVLSNKGTITGNVVIKGIPAGLVSANISNYFAAGVVGYWANLGVNQVNLPLMIRSNSQVLEIHAVPAAAATTAAAVSADLANTTQLIFSIRYQAEN